MYSCEQIKYFREFSPLLQFAYAFFFELCWKCLQQTCEIHTLCGVVCHAQFCLLQRQRGWHCKHTILFWQQFSPHSISFSFISPHSDINMFLLLHFRSHFLLLPLCSCRSNHPVSFEYMNTLKVRQVSNFEKCTIHLLIHGMAVSVCLFCRVRTHTCTTARPH